MPTRLRKARKDRGSRTCGYGKVGQHRDQGGKPYRKVGWHKHKWSYVIRYEPDYYGRRHCVSPQSLHQRVKVINIGQLDQMATKLAGEAEVVDLEKLGYTKLLGAGKLTKPLTIKVPAYSESAAQKIKDAGGNILEEAEEKGA